MAGLDDAAMLELGKTPIAGEHPCGIHALEDDRYIAVDAEISKVDRVEGGEVDWMGVEENALSLLQEKTKDIEIACYLTMAQFHNRGYAGLAAGLGLINEMVGAFWETMHPEKPRRRKARVELLGQRFAEDGNTEKRWFSAREPRGSEFDAVDLCVTRAEALLAAFKTRMPDESIDLRRFVQGLKELAGRRPKADAPPAASAGGAPAGGGAAFSAGAVGDTDGAIRALISASQFLRQSSAADPLGYAIVRLVKWGSAVLPPAGTGTDIPVPESNLIEALDHMFKTGNWRELLEAAEAAFRGGDPLWLDLQRYSCAAMNGLGPAYEGARKVVICLTGWMVGNLGEGLYGLRFKNGAPLCGGETKMWLESEVLGGSGKGGGGRGGEGMANGKLTEAVAEARQLAGSGKLVEAVTRMQGGRAACAQRRDRFLWQTRIAELCLDAQRLQLALPLLEECQEEIKRYRLDEWEPTAAIDVARMLYRCRKGLMDMEKPALEETVRRTREAYAWLCQLDPVAALSLEPVGVQ